MAVEYSDEMVRWTKEIEDAINKNSTHVKWRAEIEGPPDDPKVRLVAIWLSDEYLQMEVDLMAIGHGKLHDPITGETKYYAMKYEQVKTR